MSAPDREEALEALEAAERGPDEALAAQWRAYLGRLAVPAPPGAPVLPPVPVVHDAPRLRIELPRSEHKKDYLMVSDPSEGRLYAMVPWRTLVDVGAAPGELWFSGAPASRRRIAPEGADTAAAAADLRRRVRLPRAPLPVTAEELSADPERFHGRLVWCSGMWEHGFERSTFAGLWLEAPEPARALPSPSWVWVTGFVHAGRSGHLGASRGAIHAVDVAPGGPPADA